jgi:hypothetical protein
LSQREQHFVRIGVEDVPSLIAQHPVGPEVGDIATSDQGCVPHHVLGAAEAMRGGLVDVLAVSNTSQVGNFRGIKGTAVETLWYRGRRRTEVLAVDASHGLQHLCPGTWLLHSFWQRIVGAGRRAREVGALIRVKDISEQ